MEKELKYRLTKQVKIFGWSCKLPSTDLIQLLEKTGLYGDFEDAAIIPIPNSDLVIVKNIDILTPIVDEPEIMGEITACNVTNDVFALNVPEISGMLVFLGIKTDTPMNIAEGILVGIKNFLEKKLNSKIDGGHTIFSEWPLIGGEASGFIHKNLIIRKQGVKKGDDLILTKPLGLQPIMAAYRLLKDSPEILETYSKEELNTSIKIAIKIMTTSNQNVVKTIHSYRDFSFIHAMTDVTGFGLEGHLLEMLQRSNLSAIIETIPSIKHSESLANEFGYPFNECKCAETAGGMLIAVDSDKTEDLCNNLSSNSISNWIIGKITRSTPEHITLSKNRKNIEIEKI